MSWTLISDVRSGAALVKRFLEGGHADAPIGGKEILALVPAQGFVRRDDGLDRVDDGLAGKSRPGDLADRGGLVAGAAEGDLIGFFAGAFEAENADMADVMMAARIDAAGDFDLQRADFLRARAVAEALGNALSDRDRARCRQGAVIEARTGDDVADETGVGRGETDGSEAIIDRRQIVQGDMRQNEILLVRDAQFIRRIILGEVGDRVHLIGCRIARRAADRLERDRYDRVARDLMLRNVALHEA